MMFDCEPLSNNARAGCAFPLQSKTSRTTVDSSTLTFVVWEGLLGCAVTALVEVAALSLSKAASLCSLGLDGYAAAYDVLGS